MMGVENFRLKTGGDKGSHLGRLTTTRFRQVAFCKDKEEEAGY